MRYALMTTIIDLTSDDEDGQSTAQASPSTSREASAPVSGERPLISAQPLHTPSMRALQGVGGHVPQGTRSKRSTPSSQEEPEFKHQKYSTSPGNTRVTTVHGHDVDPAASVAALSLSPSISKGQTTMPSLDKALQSPQKSSANTAAREPSKNKTFGSYEVKCLSKPRIEGTRLPDLIQHDQMKGLYDISQASIFIGYVQEHEEGFGTLSIENTVDDQPNPPMDFLYTDGYQTSDAISPSSLCVNEKLTIPRGCDCEGERCDPATCACQRIHERLAPNPWMSRLETSEEGGEVVVPSEIRGRFAYDQNGRLQKSLADIPQTPIWECNSSCGCSDRCSNRVVQYGRRTKLTMKKTPQQGWGVFAGQDLQKGTFIMTYGGELVTPQEADRRGNYYAETGTTYLLDNDHYHIKFHYAVPAFRAACRRDPSLIPAGLTRADFDESKDADSLQAYLAQGKDTIIYEHAIEWFNLDETIFAIDGGLYGNLARFFNHSCAPNVNTFPVYTEERDLRKPFLAFFTNKFVYAGEQLCFSYNDGDADDDIGDASKLAIDAETSAFDSAMEGVAPGVEVRVADVAGAAKHSNKLTTMKCSCQAPNCRGRIFR